MAYYLIISSGPEEGKFAEVIGECVIGRSGDAGLQVEDESVSWEHAIIRETGDKLVIENLSALGTTVNGESVVGEKRLNHGDELALSPRCSVRVESRLGGGAGRKTSPLLIIAAIVVVGLLAVGGVAYVVIQKAAQVIVNASTGPPTGAEWRKSYVALCDRLDDWERSGRVSPDLAAAFEDAWLTEQSGQKAEAHRLWTSLWSNLLSDPVPGSRGALIGVEKGLKPTELSALMGRADPAGARTDEDYAAALVWFVRVRSTNTKPE